MGKQKKVLMCAALSVILALSLLAGCGNKEEKKETGTAETSANTSGTEQGQEASGNVTPDGALPRLKNKVELTMLVGTDTNVEDMDTNEYIVMLEEAVNVDLKFEYLPAGNDGKQKLSVMLASGSKLPDTVVYNLNAIEAYTYGSQGNFLPLNDYIEKDAYYFKEYLNSEEGQENLKYIKSADGNIYAFPSIIEELSNDYDHRMWINQTWLDKLGLKKPATTEEYYEVLKAFKEKDPNGNGKADEIPLVGNRTGWQQEVWKTLMYPFTFVNDYFDYLVVGEDGKLTVSYAKPEWKDGLTYMNRLCTEGLLSPLTFTQDEAQMKQILGDPDGQVIGSLCAGSMSTYAASPERKKDMTHMGPLTGPKGICYTSFRATYLPNYVGYITKDCKDPQAAAVMFDYMYTEEMAMQGRYGTKGKSWKEAEPGKEGMFADMGYEANWEIIDNIWGTVQNQLCSETFPTLRTYAMSAGQVVPDDPYNAQYMSAKAMPDYVGKYPEDIVLRLIYTQEEADQIAEILASLTTYRDESVVAFITGTRSLSEWDSYLKELETIGLPEFLEVAQRAYDRMNQN